MSRQLIGRRGGDDSGWTWVLVPGPPPPQRRWLVALALLLLMVVVGLPLGLLLALRPNGEPTTAAPPLLETPAATRFRLALWADREGRWRLADLDGTSSAYREGEAIPFLLRIDNAQAGATYSIVIRYQCRQDGIGAYDFLTGYERDRGRQPALGAEGPGGGQASAAMAIPDDPSLPFDDGEADRFFQLWGASFSGDPRGPLPATLCLLAEGAEKRYELTIVAEEETVFLLWGGHLASRRQWGGGLGAASLPRSFPLTVEVDGERLHLSVARGAVLPAAGQ